MVFYGSDNVKCLEYFKSFINDLNSNDKDSCLCIHNVYLMKGGYKSFYTNQKYYCILKKSMIPESVEDEMKDVELFQSNFKKNKDITLENIPIPNNREKKKNQIDILKLFQSKKKKRNSKKQTIICKMRKGKFKKEFNKIFPKSLESKINKLLWGTN